MTQDNIDSIIDAFGLPYSGDDPDLLDALRWGSDTELVHEEIIDQRRWVTTYRIVFKLPSGRFVALIEDRGSTEMQENAEEYELVQVRPQEVTTVEYVRV